MRKTPIIVGAVVAGLAALGGVSLMLVDVNQFRPTIQSQLESALHRGVTLGPMGFKLWPLSIRIDDVKIGDAPEFASPAPFLRAKELYVRVDFPALLQKQVKVDSLRIVQPQVELIRNRAGQWNYQSLSGSSSGQGAVGIADLEVQDGSVAVTDRKAAQPRAVYDHIDIALRDYAPGRRFDLTGTVHLPANGKEQIALKAQGTGAGDLDGTLTLSSVSLAAVRAFLGSAGAEVQDVVLNGEAKIAARANTISVAGALTVADRQIKQPIALDYQFSQNRQTGVLDIMKLNAKLGDVSATGHGQMKMGDTPVAMDLEFDTGNAPVAELLSLARLAGVGDGMHGSGTLALKLHITGTSSAPNYSGSGSLRNASFSMPALRKPLEAPSADLRFTENQASVQNLNAGIGTSHVKGSATVRNFAHPDIAFAVDMDHLDTAELQSWMAPPAAKTGPRGSASPLNGSGTINIGKLTIHQITMTQVHAGCTFEGGVIKLDPESAAIFGGQQSGSITVDARHAPPSYSIVSRMTGVDANQLLSATSAVRNVIYGVVATNASLQIVPPTGTDFAQGMNGTVQLQLTKGKLTGIHLLNEMAKVGRFLGYAGTSEPVTNIGKLAGTMNIRNGVANTDDLQMEFDGGSLSGAGAVNLVDQSLNLKVTTILAKDISAKVGGNQIGGYLSTALANPRGELVIPSIVSGTLAKPRFEPDPARIARMKIEGLLPTKDGLGGLIGAFTGKPQPGAASNGKTNADRQVNNVIDLFNSFKKKKETGK